MPMIAIVFILFFLSGHEIEISLSSGCSERSNSPSHLANFPNPIPAQSCFSILVAPFHQNFLKLVEVKFSIATHL